MKIVEMKGIEKDMNESDVNTILLFMNGNLCVPIVFLRLKERLLPGWLGL